MPSPLAHSAMGYLIYRMSRSGKPGRQPQPQSWVRDLLAPQLWLLVGLSILPDLDAIAGFLLNDMAGFHNNGTHSLLIGLLVALLVAGTAWWREKEGFFRWLVIAFAGYAMHVLMDAVTFDSRGVMLFWPLSQERFLAPFSLFYGVRWSDGLFSVAHLVTLATELVFTVLVVWVANLWDQKRGNMTLQWRSKHDLNAE
jgi:membrane-bound metal-dependent hydrolase YbcI (DUF457 family)